MKAQADKVLKDAVSRGDVRRCRTSLPCCVVSSIRSGQHQTSVPNQGGCSDLVAAHDADAERRCDPIGPPTR